VAAPFGAAQRGALGSRAWRPPARLAQASLRSAAATQAGRRTAASIRYFAGSTGMPINVSTARKANSSQKMPADPATMMAVMCQRGA
jgi:hypothetical protein